MENETDIRAELRFRKLRNSMYTGVLEYSQSVCKLLFNLRIILNLIFTLIYNDLLNLIFTLIYNDLLNLIFTLIYNYLQHWGSFVCCLLTLECFFHTILTHSKATCI